MEIMQTKKTPMKRDWTQASRPHEFVPFLHLTHVGREHIHKVFYRLNVHGIIIWISAISVDCPVQKTHFFEALNENV